MKNEWLDETKTTTTDDPRRIPCASSQKRPNRTLILKNARIFDSTGKAPYLGTVVLERNKIKEILSTDETDWPADARVIDVKGKTLMPGLIDGHTHLDLTPSSQPPLIANDIADCTLRSIDRMAYYIESGITSIRDCASNGTVSFRLKEWVSKNLIPGPRIFAAGQLITSTGGHGAEGTDSHVSFDGFACEVSGPDEWRNKVRQQYKRGADFIKTGSFFSKEEIKAAVEEAHALGVKITTDAERYYIEWAVEAGIDTVEHPLPRTDKVIQMMADLGVESVPTMVPYDIIIDAMGGYFGSTTRRFTLTKDGNLTIVRKMKDAGIKMGIGTDIFYEVYRAISDVYLLEMQNFEKIGYSPSEILCIATKTNAEILDMDDKLGTIESGKLADLIILDGKPDEDLTAIKNVEMVIRDGYIVVDNGKINIERHQQPSLESLIEQIKKIGNDFSDG
ncbi:MAG: amidohydrolase family protein [Promethearchaeota archaeon]